MRRFALRAQKIPVESQPVLLRAGGIGSPDACRCLFADLVCRVPAAEGEEGRVGQGKGEFCMQDALLRIDDGEVRVGRKALCGQFGDLVVVADARPAALLVAPDDELYRAAGEKPLVFQRFQGVQADDGGALVVDRAAPVQPAVFDPAAEGRVRPALARGDDVEVA